MIRVTWKDTNGHPCSPVAYRKVFIERYKGGWLIDIKGDNNIYSSQDSAKNAIDKILGGKPRRNGEKRKAKGIKIIGTK